VRRIFLRVAGPDHGLFDLLGKFAVVLEFLSVGMNWNTTTPEGKVTIEVKGPERGQ
jgi:hypothetical protein